MRLVSLAALTATGFALAGCGGGETASLNLAAGLDVCGLSCPEDNSKPEKSSVIGKLPTAPPTKNSGNDVNLDVGEDTIALEKSIMISNKSTISTSKLTLDKVAKTAKFDIDTKTNRNSFWPKTKTMEYYEFGSINSEPEDDGGPVTSPGGTGLGGTYTEYRMLSTTANEGTAIDEELQYWKWKNSYGVQYRDVTSGGPEADHHAWSFGGKRTAAANMPTGGKATYSGQFGSTSKTTNWLNTQDQRQTLSYNNDWQVRGTSDITADFGKNTVNATLTPKKWRAFQTMNGATGFKTVTVDNIPAGAMDPNSASYDPNIVYYMFSDIKLKGTITKDALKGNKVKGSAYMDGKDGWISNSTLNPFAGGFFGTNADEFTGIFNVEATLPRPIGGAFPITGDRRANIQHSGVVHGEKQ